MNAQKGKGRRVKRKQVQAGDGWTVVAGSGKGMEGTERLRDARPTRVVDGLTVEKLVEELKEMESRWKRTSCAKNLEAMLKLRDFDVDQAVCIGIGSFCLDWDHRYRSLWQLVLFMAVVKLLQHNNNTISLYAQEPAFTSLDTSFLAAFSIHVLPVAVEDHITPSSFVFAPFVDWYLLLPIFLKNKDPQLYIGNEVLDNYRIFANTREKEAVLKECEEEGKKFVIGKERRRVPEFEGHGSALEGLMMYWKEEEED